MPEQPSQPALGATSSPTTPRLLPEHRAQIMREVASLSPAAPLSVDDVPIVSSAEDAFSWAWDFQEVVEKLCPPMIAQNFKKNISGMTYSTCFAGIDAPGSSGIVTVETFNARKGTNAKHFEHLAACEWNSPCQIELGQHPSRPHHLYSDVLQFFREPLRSRLKARVAQKRPMSLSSLLAVIKQDGIIDMLVDCMHCNGKCKHPRARTHFAGLPCVTWSPVGGREGADGWTMIYYAAWAALRHTAICGGVSLM